MIHMLIVTGCTRSATERGESGARALKCHATNAESCFAFWPTRKAETCKHKGMFGCYYLSCCCGELGPEHQQVIPPTQTCGSQLQAPVRATSRLRRTIQSTEFTQALSDRLASPRTADVYRPAGGAVSDRLSAGCSGVKGFKGPTPRL